MSIDNQTNNIELNSYLMHCNLLIHLKLNLIYNYLLACLRTDLFYYII